MKLVVFGATGGTGRCILDLALAAGHDVLALARKPEAIPLRDHLAVEQGDVLVAEDVASAVQGADAVLSAFGPARGDYKHGAGRAINAAAKLPHADVAAFMIACASDPPVVRTIQNIGR